MADTFTLLWLAPALVAVAAIGAMVADRLIRRPDFVVVGFIVGWVGLPLVASVWDAFTGPVALDDTPRELTGAVLWLSRISTLVILLVIGACLVRVTSRRIRMPRAGSALLFGAAAYLGVLVLRGIADLGSGGGRIPQGELLSLLTVICLAVAPRVSPSRIADILKWLMAATVLLSLLVIVLRPERLVPYGGGLLPGFPYRTAGVLSHPNSLGPAALLYLALERYRPSPRWLRPVLILSGVAILLAAQSKTAWVAAAFVVVMSWAAGGRSRPAIRLAGAVLATFAAGAVLLVGNVDYGAFVSEDRLESTRSLTGRTALWERGLEAWRDQPVFGAGLDTFRRIADQIGQPWAGQAHNEGVQALGTTGLVGFAALLLYVAVLLRSGYRLRELTSYTSIVLVGMLLIRALTEAYLRDLGSLHFSVICLLFSWEYERAHSPILSGAPVRAEEAHSFSRPRRLEATHRYG